MNTFSDNVKLSDHICLGEALERFGNQDLFYQMLEIFRTESPPLMEHLRRAFLQGDLNEVGAQAHRLKGSLSMLGAKSAADQAERLRVSTLRGDEETARTLYEDLTRSVGELFTLLDSQNLHPPIL